MVLAQKCWWCAQEAIISIRIKCLTSRLDVGIGWRNWELELKQEYCCFDVYGIGNWNGQPIPWNSNEAKQSIVKKPSLPLLYWRELGRSFLPHASCALLPRRRVPCATPLPRRRAPLHRFSSPPVLFPVGIASWLKPMVHIPITNRVSIAWVEKFVVLSRFLEVFKVLSPLIHFLSRW